MRWYHVIGRLLFGGVLVCAAARSVTDASLSLALAAHGLPYAEGVGLAAAIMLGIAGASIALGLFAQVGLRLAVLYLALAAVVQHAFWSVPEGATRSLEVASFVHHLGLIGAAIALMALPSPWPLSLDAWLATRPAQGRSWRPAVPAWLERAVSALRPAAHGGGANRSPNQPIVAEPIRGDAQRAYLPRAGGVVYHVRRAVRAEGGRVLFVQSICRVIGAPDREYV